MSAKSLGRILAIVILGYLVGWVVSLKVALILIGLMMSLGVILMVRSIRLEFDRFKNRGGQQ